jgi:transposase
MAIADSHGLPVAICTESAESHEIKLVTETIEHKFAKGKIELLIGDKAYDSDVFDEYLKKHYEIQLVAPHKVNRVKPQTQDGRQLRRYRNRWKIERMFSWFNHFRRILTRWEYYQINFYGFIILACIVILIRHL